MNPNEIIIMIESATDDDYDIIHQLLLDPRSTQIDLPAEITESALCQLKFLIALLSDLELTNLRISHEICPMHACDINICIDDQIAECIQYQ